MYGFGDPRRPSEELWTTVVMVKTGLQSLRKRKHRYKQEMKWDAASDLVNWKSMVVGFEFKAFWRFLCKPWLVAGSLAAIRFPRAMRRVEKNYGESNLEEWVWDAAKMKESERANVCLFFSILAFHPTSPIPAHVSNDFCIFIVLF